MLDRELIEEVRESPIRPAPTSGAATTAITALGRAVALAEARRVTDLLSQARAAGLIPRKL